MVAHRKADAARLHTMRKKGITVIRHTHAGQVCDRLGAPIVTPLVANRLARICAYSAQAPEWELFVRAVSPVVALAARRVSAVWGDSSDGTVSEIVQEVFLKLCEDDP